MCHAALNCAVRYCIVDQAVLGVRILTELIWILSSSCLNAELGLPAVETRGALDQLEHKIRFSSEALARDILAIWPREWKGRAVFHAVPALGRSDGNANVGAGMATGVGLGVASVGAGVGAGVVQSKQVRSIE